MTSEVLGLSLPTVEACIKALRDTNQPALADKLQVRLDRRRRVLAGAPEMAGERTDPLVKDNLGSWPR